MGLDEQATPLSGDSLALCKYLMLVAVVMVQEVNVTKMRRKNFVVPIQRKVTRNRIHFLDIKSISDKSSDTGSQRLKVMVIAILFARIGVLLFIICCFWRKFSLLKSINFWKKETLTQHSVKAFLRNQGPLVIRRYKCSDIKKITKSFKDKLGQEGYGSVYKGKLQDGSFVAVKILNELKGNGEEFINEVASISRTSHVNIVTLKGFCFEGSKRALIYELMPNGSFDKFIYKGNPSNVNQQLGWETLYKIAIGIAQGLEYLHKGCNTRILHFDIKPHNILLDENFCPKISNIGLSKICLGLFNEIPAPTKPV
ncbi:PR5-like receptor kinase [Quercus suber]|uniref:PR5-like receptor kinase n=1 Tax=Quercus suber TaxID=58331 RepID=UPI0032DF9449